MNIDWNTELADQLDWHWQNHFRPGLEGLGDQEYLWEPVRGCWSIRPRDAESAVEAKDRFGAGDFVLEYGRPEPKPAPVTTIAWRLAHIIVGCLGMRSASHFGGPAMDWRDFSYAGTAADALDQLDAGYEIWMKGVRALGEAGLAEPCGPAEGPYAEYSMASLVLHINRECLHHGAEITLLRDLYRWKGDQDGL
ncbi:MAG TPA: DinB family protein [Streptosporangiaceae bacterium]